MRVEKSIKDLEIKDENGTILIKRGSVADLGLENGQVVILRKQPGLSEEVVESLAERLGDLGYGRCVIVVVNRLSDIKALDEEQMRRHGWVKHGTKSRDSV